MKKFVSLLLCALVSPVLFAADPLPSWNDTAAKESIIDFVETVTKQGSADFVPVSERIATFDNDGCLWAEQPMYFQLAYVLDRIKAIAAGSQHPEWKNTEPFASVLKGDVKAALAGGEKSIAELMAATHAGMTTEEFEKSVNDWITTAKHPTTGRLYTEMAYQPMLELLAFLRENGFKTFIVSGGGIEFMRPWAERIYGIPPEQVVGSSGGLTFEMRDGKPVIVKTPELVLNDDKEGKPVGIQRHIGRRPIAAFGNSDGDLQMLQWTAAGSGPRFCLYVHHTDAEREWAYDRDSHIGKLDKGLDEAHAKDWTVVSMKDDWKTIFAWEKGASKPDGSKPGAGPAGALTDVMWHLKTIDGKPALPSEGPRGAGMKFISRDGTIAANTSVNSMGGSYTLKGETLTFEQGMMTMMAGPEPLMQQEQAFIAALGRVTTYRIEGRTLTLLAGDEAVLTFEQSD